MQNDNSATNTDAKAAYAEPRKLANYLEILLIACIAVLYAARAFTWESLSDNDPCYYFGVAKHMVETGRFEEPIVWHYLLPTSGVPHTPFDYWPAGPVFLLIPAFWLFGVSKVVAATVFTSISLATVILFNALLKIVAPKASVYMRLAFTWLFAMSPALKTYRFEPEGIGPFQFCMLIVLHQLMRGNLVCALCAGFASVFFRGDGILFFVGVSLGLVSWCVYRRKDMGWQPFVKIAASTLLLASAYGAFNYALHGHFLPPAAAVTPKMSNYMELYIYGHKNIITSGALFLKVLSPSYFIQRAEVFWGGLPYIWDFRVMGGAGMLLVGICLLFVIKRHHTGLALCGWFILHGLALCSQPVMFAPHRTLFVLVPLIYLIVAVAVAEGVEWIAKGHSQRLSLVVSISILWLLRQDIV